MNYRSTRGKAQTLGFSAAVQAGLASDGGLYVPERFPDFGREQFPRELSFARLAQMILERFAAGDPVQSGLAGICERAFDFPAPVKPLRDATAVLELFHGPTAAFKDFGARFLAECRRSIRKPGSRPDTVLVATSGDTGGAVAAAFFGKPETEVCILFPKGRISARQEKQLTAWGGNVRAFSVRGSFDDCQRMVKEAFLSPQWQASRNLVSANSINIGRILPQATYHAAASLQYFTRTGERPGLIIPSGNLGNALAALWAKKMGFPIRAVVMATNANSVVSEFVDTGRFEPRPSVSTLANAMDVGRPSNLERLRHLYPDPAALRQEVQAFSVSDEQIRKTISEGPAHWGEVWCPHTATAVHAREQLKSPHWILVATAHPAKFETIVEPLIGRSVEVPPALREILSRPSRATEIDPELQALQAALA